MINLDNPMLFLATANAGKSRDFYERVLGLRLVADEPPALVFQVGATMLRIQKVDHVAAARYTALGWAVSDIRQTVRQLHAAGVAFQHYEGIAQDQDGIWQAPSGALVAWFRDPDGHILSLTEFAEFERSLRRKNC
jgi:catechol 2,3-dioxygenase-like lactoylglutathione lyase family enzyme